ncbi:MerR family transcriptional regulator [Mitsuaria sp. GD03876]|uniref:MerR family transcriptional regulator n=1 Tax=Mitsuaria sp. GD03876 TaxID=2975399 RepID=UPI002448AA51|nr:MerR family transcriptional regulator [Mitsuaria sp. GD03876]MDH0867935.1 MerR family transcriptional regulator [Mitsuaria sp. GD03876]
MRIGELAKQLGIKTSAIRFYEASGLLPQGHRGANGYREYGPAALERLQFIQLSQRLGFSLDSLRRAFAQESDGRVPHEVVLEGLRRRREEIARMRAELDAQDAELERLAQACSDSWSTGECLDPGVYLSSVGER